MSTRAALTLDPDARCPDCAGRRLYSLVYAHTTACGIRDLTDARLAADHAMFGRYAGTWTRTTTAAERALLTAAGVPGQAIPDLVTLHRITASVIVPRWDGLDLGGIP